MITVKAIKPRFQNRVKPTLARQTRRAIAGVIALTSCFWLPAALGWSATGHQLTCEVAASQLTDPVKTRIQALMQALPDAQRDDLFDGKALTFADLCTWADQVRPLKQYRSVASWHYVNVARDASSVNYDKCVTGCLLTAIETHIGLLQQTELSPWPRLQSLMFLSHWIGDLHQPLHVSFFEDLGGNRTQVTGYDDCANLHGVWDFCLVSTTGKSRSDLLVELLALPGADGFDQGTALSWAQESLDLVTHPRVQYCRKSEVGCAPWSTQRYALSPDYQAINWPVAKLRLAQAGYRLAGLMNTLMAAP
ncbi:S1/P1 nuclease [Pseudomonadales bacterium]|jgi:hypothetical protein|nr:S1/P1 nuclease [Pseudomonadales bacterium]